MSLQDMEESHDKLQRSETKLLSSMDSESLDSEEPRISTPLPSSSNISKSFEDLHLTLEEVNSGNEVAEQRQSTVEANSFISDLNHEALGSTCGLSNSERSNTATDLLSYPYYPMSFHGGIFSEYEWRLFDFRSKGYLLPFEIICLIFTVACCFMGAYNWPSCPADINIPRYLFFNGALATFSLCMHIVYTLWRIIFRRQSRFIIGCALVFGWAAMVMTMVEMIEFYTMSYSFQRLKKNYCNEVFYWFVHYANIAFGGIIVLTAALYFPSCGSYLRFSIQFDSLLDFLL